MAEKRIGAVDKVLGSVFLLLGFTMALWLVVSLVVVFGQVIMEYNFIHMIMIGG